MPEELKELQVQDLILNDRRDWDMGLIQSICNERDVNLIRQIHIPLKEREDRWMWLFDSKGEFSVKSCYRRIRGEKVYEDGVFWKRLWNLQLPGKVLNFLWRVCRGVLPTAEALVRKNVNMTKFCSWCQTEVEDEKHILFTCHFAREVWHELGMQQLVTVMQEDTIITVFKRVFRTGTREQCVMLGLFCWSMWFRRNKWVWDKATMSVFGVKAMALNMLNDWRKAMEKASRESQMQQVARNWQKPPPGWVKINMDAACKQGDDCVKLGCVARDENGNFLRGRSNVLQRIAQPREAEGLSLKEAISWTSTWRTEKCIFETDSKLLVDAVNGIRGRSYFDLIAEDCHELMKHFDEVLLVFVPRSANRVAHLLAKAAGSLSGLQEWDSTAPELIHCNLALEAL